MAGIGMPSNRNRGHQGICKRSKTSQPSRDVCYGMRVSVAIGLESYGRPQAQFGNVDGWKWEKEQASGGF